MIKAIITGMILVVALMAESQTNYLNDDQNMIRVIGDESSALHPQPVSLGMNNGMDFSVTPKQDELLSLKSEPAPRNLEINATATQSVYKESKLERSQTNEKTTCSTI